MTLAHYFDEDSMDADLIEALRARHFDVVTALQANMLNRPDDEHLDYAAREARIVYSADARDFCRIHTERLSRGTSHAVIVIVEQQRYSVSARPHALLRLAAQHTEADMQGHIEFLSNWV